MSLMQSRGAAAAGGAAGGVLRPASEVETVELGPNRVAFPLGPADTGGAYSLTEFAMAPPPAPGPPPHIHEDADEAVYVIEGTLEMGIDGRTLSGSAGSAMFVPRGTLHSLANPGPAPARMLVILTPAGYEGFWREMAALRAQLGGPPDPAAVTELQGKYHMVTGGPARRFD